MREFCMDPSITDRWSRALWLLAVVPILAMTSTVADAIADYPVHRAEISTGLVKMLCVAGCPRGGPLESRIIQRENYILSNNGGTKFADWVAYVVTPALFGPSRKRVWRADPDLTDAETLEPEDYRGAHAALGIDRGHQVPLASFAGVGDWPATNYLSIVTPQKSPLNRGPWARLEEAIRRLARSIETNAVHVITGPLYEKDMPGLPNADEPHVIPSGYWKVIAFSGGKRLGAIAFVMNQNTPRSADFCGLGRRIDIPGLERRTGLRLFPELDARELVALKLGARSLARRLGCEN
jgi:endonuclease G, mitochondrial